MEERSIGAIGVEVRWERGEDCACVLDLIEFAGSSRRSASESRFIVAEDSGKVVAAVCVVATPERMTLWGFVADPRVREGEVAAALYGGASELARELGIREVWIEDDRRIESLLEVGYRRKIGGWSLDVGQKPDGGPRRLFTSFAGLFASLFRRF